MSFADLGKDVNETDIMNMFQSVGKVSSVKIPKDTNTRMSLGYAYVNFVDTASGKCLDASRSAISYLTIFIL